MTRYAVWLALVATLVLSGSPVSAAGAIGTVIEGGGINQADASHGPAYLAIRAPRGTLVRLCGPAGCILVRSTDYGPVKGTGKIADLAIALWPKVCGTNTALGWCTGSIEYPLDVPALPPTDQAPAPWKPDPMWIVFGAILGVFVGLWAWQTIEERWRR